MGCDSRKIAAHQVDSGVAQLDPPPPAVEMVVAKADQAFLLQATHPAERGRARKLGTVGDVPNRVAALKDMGFEKMQQDFPRRSRVNVVPEKAPRSLRKLRALRTSKRKSKACAMLCGIAPVRLSSPISVIVALRLRAAPLSFRKFVMSVPLLFRPALDATTERKS